MDPHAASDSASRLPPDDARAAPDTASHGAASHGAPFHDAPFHDAMAQVAKLKDFAVYYLSARWDGIKRSARDAALLTALGVLGGVVGASALVTATVLLCLGIAGALGALMGGIRWLGYLVFGVLVLLLLGVGAWLGLRWFKEKARKQMVKKYETWKRKQRERYGSDVRQQAAHGRQ